MLEIFFYQPIFNFLVLVYNIAGSNLGVALIGVAVLSRLIMYPFTQKQLENAEKAQGMRKEMEKIKQKYAKNKEKQAEEMSKLQAKHLPGQIGGCLPLILMIVFFFQIRGTINDLVNQGWHAFNEVAYVQSLEKDQDTITFETGEALSKGEHTLKYELKSEKGNTLTKEINFEVVDDVEKRVEEIEKEEKTKSGDTKKEEGRKREEMIKQEKHSDIAIYNKTLEDNKEKIVIERLLFFTLSSTEKYLLTDEKPTFETFIRPPSDQRMLAGETRVYLDGNEVTQTAKITQGEPIDLTFLGFDMSKTAYDIGLENLGRVWPYIVLAVLVGISQFGSTWITTNVKLIGDPNKKKEEKAPKKKKKPTTEPDFSEMMQSSGKQMLYILPVMTAFFSLNFIAGLSLYWTVQSLFVIIQQLIRERKKLIEWLRIKLNQPATSGIPL